MSGVLVSTACLLVWLVAAGFKAWQWSPSVATLVWSLFGVTLGWLSGGPLSRSRLRLSTIWGGGALVLLGGMIVSQGLRDVDFVSNAVGPVLALMSADSLLFFCAWAPLLACLRATSLRWRPGIILEAGCAGTMLAAALAAHREGFVNRPYFLADYLWARGWDPLPWLLAFGAAAGLALIVLAAGRSERKNPLDVMLLTILVAAIFLIFPSAAVKDVLQPPSGSGASPSPKPSLSPERGGKASKDGSGNQDQPSFANQSSSSGNPPVAVVLFHDDYEPPDAMYYFRQTIFSYYNGLRVVRDSSEDDREASDTFPDAPRALRLGPQPLGTRILDTDVALMTEHTRPFGLIAPQMLVPRPNPDQKRFDRAYAVVSRVNTRTLRSMLGLAAGDAAWTPEQRRHYLEIPNDPRYKQLAAKILQQLPVERRNDPLLRAAVIKMWLEENGVYSRESAHADGPDPVGDFLFGDVTGYCVHFAHAACFLYRAVGVPARLGAGYAVPAQNRGRGSSLLIRGSDSHTWPEIKLEGADWMPLDISPKRSTVPPDEPPDQGLQQMLGDMARKQSGKADDTKKEPAKDLQQQLRQGLAAVARMIPWLLLVLLAACYAVKGWRRLAPAWSDTGTAPRLAYRATLDRLADCGRVRRFGQTREDFAEQNKDLCPELLMLTWLHQRQALSGKGDARGREDVLFVAEDATRSMQARVPLKRRVLGWLNPISWMSVK